MSQPGRPTTRPNLFRRVWVAITGETDPIERQLNATAREGALLAHVAHLCAFLMLLLFSLGSLIALAGDSVQAIAAGHITIPAIIAAAVSTLLVACMDTGMLYAASMLRLLAARRAEKADGRLHRFVLASVAILEAGTYCYMSYRYEHPADAMAWGLIVARSLAAPLLSVYLSLARPLPVVARDMLALAERIAGEGVLRDIARIAGDTSAPLAEKVGIYIAAAVISPADHTRLSALLEVAQRRGMAQEPAQIVDATPAPAQTQAPPVDPLVDPLPVAQFTPWELLPQEFQSAPIPVPPSAQEPDPTPPGGPGTPTKRPRKRRDVITPTPSRDTKVLKWPTTRTGTRRRKSASSRGPRLSVEQKARAAFRVGMSASELARTAHIGKSAASKYRTLLTVEASQTHIADQAAQ